MAHGRSLDTGEQHQQHRKADQVGRRPRRRATAHRRDHRQRQRTTIASRMRGAYQATPRNPNRSAFRDPPAATFRRSACPGPGSLAAHCGSFRTACGHTGGDHRPGVMTMPVPEKPSD